MPVPFKHAFCAMTLAFAFLADPVQAADPAVRLGQLRQHQIDQLLYLAAGHPNEFWRYHGLRQHLSGRDAEAASHFERAARYADKPSQHYLSLMYWYGQGVPQDRVQAYIWSDIAAERGQRNMLRIREKMWLELTDAQRAQVIERGEAMHRRYADAYTKIHAERALFRLATQITGSRAGYNDGRLQIGFGGPFSGEGGSDGMTMYGDERTDRRVYWQAQDRMLAGSLRASVIVGPIEPNARPGR